MTERPANQTSALTPELEITGSSDTGAGAQVASDVSTGWRTVLADRQQPASVSDQQQRPADRAAQIADRGQPTDRMPQPGAQGVMELSYKDPDFDQKLSAGNASILRIKDFPKEGVNISSWIDDKGFFMWFPGGADGGKPHYLPRGLKTIEVNGATQDVDEMKIQASLESMKRADREKIGFSSVNGLTDPVQFAQRMGGLGAAELARQEKWLRDSADSSPTNPYFRIYLADVLLAQAFKPIIDQVASGQSQIEMNSPFTQQKMQQAQIEVRRAQEIAKNVGDARYPNEQLQPELQPFNRNPRSNNPDLFWHGALYQAWQREVSLSALQQYLLRFSTLELPPDMSQR